MNIERTRRANRRWTEPELFALLANTATVPTATLAKRLKTTRRVIQHLYRKLGISPLDNDGKYTAAKLSRQTGIPSPTLIDWLRKGQLPGEKVGPYWRIEWDGESEVKPLWNGKSIHRELLKPQERREYCAFCGKKLGKSDIWCSRLCRNEHTKKLNLERRTKKE